MDTEDRGPEFLMKEVETIQAIIARMAQTSFLIKGWATTILVGSLVLTTGHTEAPLAVAPLLMFWFLDALYLRQERLYVKLHRWVAQHRLETLDHLFDLDTRRFAHEVGSVWGVMFSVTLLWFYGGLLILTASYCAYSLCAF